MATKTVKISEENYRQLIRIAGELQRIEGRSISMDEALRSVLVPKKTMTDLANIEGAKELADAIEKVYKERRKHKDRKYPGW